MSRILLKVAGIFAGLAVCGALLVGLALALAYPNLPDLDALTDYHPKMPLRVYTADNSLIGEFGEERRNVVRIREVPDVLKSAILSAEDDRFYQHGGIDWSGVMRAALTNLVNFSKSQGASTITMQVARNFYLSSEKTWTRKLYEILLTFKIEASLTKDQILELYINQIYLGQRAYGFASAARIYYGKPLSEITAAEAAMLAGIPKAPSRYNPVVNPTRAKLRQQYVLQRMLSLGYLTEPEYHAALDEKLKIRQLGGEFGVRAEYVAELARQLVYDIYKEETYTRGLNVYTTVDRDMQDAAYDALRDGVLDYERRHGYRGPEGFVDLPNGIDNDPEKLNDAVDDALDDYPDSDTLLAAVVLSADAKTVRVARSSGEIIDITGKGLKFVQPALSPKAQPSVRLRRGAIVRILKTGNDWEILQTPQVQAAFVSTDPQNGAIRAMVGGFDFHNGKFNRVTQAWRQPGSSFKPFIYAAALERGLTPATIVSDDPFVLEASATGSQRWEPKNYDGRNEAPMSMRQGLAKSKNMVSIRVLQSIGPQYAQDYITRFGFDAARHPAYLTMALGAGSVTPLQMAGAYSVFANGGYRVTPYLIEKVTDSTGRVLMQARPTKAGDESLRAIDARTAYIADSMLRDVVRVGTARAALSLKRKDVGGKTGTTNNSVDAWFAGYTPGLVGIAWLGYDQPRSLGVRETGGGAAMPIWLKFMQRALKDIPQHEQPMPPGIIVQNGDYYFAEFPPGQAVASVGLPPPPADPMSRLIDSLGNLINGNGNGSGGTGGNTSNSGRPETYLP
ncbi:penicillin-binding protein [Pigmentiphaga sp. NML080357]|uniref:penicillin-binding protein 1A n=1 Tax=Pigmentiphaga sp. NML080357 TaxID=2008675 RepID=UPI000B40E1A1|nr:penicillin-binding protein 1A [Pigmentiphaga sp. NML080357]OVZ60426.1 penicillin-binding protein [Pigmentiphaga sp. NML080357]